MLRQGRIVMVAALVFCSVVSSYGERQTFLPGPSFTPDKVLTGSSLAGWHTVGEATWQMHGGELTGAPGASGKGGWLVMDHSFQDVEMFTKFRCAGGCETGILFRVERTPEGGMKGTYASFSEGDVVKYYAITTDANGVIADRTPLRTGGGKERVAPPAPEPKPGQVKRAPRTPNPYSAYGQTPGVAYPYSKPDSNLYADEWNDVELIFDANILRGDQNNGRESGGVSESSSDYGPIALYVGGKGTVEFKDVAYKDINDHFRAKDYTSPDFKRQTLNTFYYSWGAAVADFNRDGTADIVSGPYVFYGPDYTHSSEIYLAETVNPSTGWATKAWMEFAADFTGDGWPDVLACKFIDADMGCYLYVNPKGEHRRWEVHRVLDKFDSERALLKEIDGHLAVVYTADGYVRYAEPDPANPTGSWTVHNVSERGYGSAHGIGVGDLNGDGKADILTAFGWWEHPAEGASMEGPWTYHPEVFGRYGTGVGGSGMSVYDVNGDGLNDIVTVLDAHGWGMAWFEQKRDAQGKITFVRHMIMDAPGTKSAGGVTFTEAHGDVTADMNGDGIPDFVVGKRYWTHLDDYADPDPYGTPVLYWYETVRDKKAPGGARFVPHLIDDSSGSGSDISAADLNHDGRMDLVTATRMGTFVFWNELKGKGTKASGSSGTK